MLIWLNFMEITSSLPGADYDVRADSTTRGRAISLVTAASVALADCFLIFFLPMIHQ
jgi:hypothetical protein